jgi:hypothetical protein
MILRAVTLHDSGGTTLLTLQARDNDVNAETPTRNTEGVQPPASNIQGAFGDGLHKVGVLERDFALCNTSGYDSIYHAKAALDTALSLTASIRVSGWELPIASVQGVTEWQHLLVGLRARVRFVPRSAFWRYLTGTQSGQAYQLGTEVVIASGIALDSADAGRLFVWANGAEARILGVDTLISATADISQTVNQQNVTLYACAAGLL